MKVGVRELRENLRSWLERVKSGEEVVITDRGNAIAQLAPIESGRRRLEELIELRIVRPPLRPKRQRIDISRLPKLEGAGPTLSDIVVQQRRSSR